MTERPTEAELYMDAARLFSKRSTCVRGHVGAVIVRDRRIISHGYNGAPPGLPHCDEVGCDNSEIQRKHTCPKCEGRGETMECDPCVRCGSRGWFWVTAETGCQRAIHAEVNAIAWAGRSGIPIVGSTMYSTHGPCPACARMIAVSGIAAVVYDIPYRDPAGVELLTATGTVDVRRFHA